MEKTRYQLHRPLGFSDSHKFALNPLTGELLFWPNSTLEPEDFSIDIEGNVWHYTKSFDGVKNSYSRILRHGLSANNFFVNDETKIGTKIGTKSECKIGARKTSEANSSIKFKNRKKKYRKKKYKNSNARNKNYPDKRNKKKYNIHTQNTVFVPPPYSKEICNYCLSDDTEENIFLSPFQHFRCDFCNECFNGYQWLGKVCGQCLDRTSHHEFCPKCRDNLGAWHRNWRQDIDVPFTMHPSRCSCDLCVQQRSYVSDWSPDWDAESYWDQEAEEREMQIRDDYLFGET